MRFPRSEAPYLFSMIRLSLFLAALLVSTTGADVRAGEADRGAMTYDVVVYGGTSAGIITAVQAARMGKSVVLIEPTQHLGGMTSGGLGATDIGRKAAIGGLALEFYQRVARKYQDDRCWTLKKRGE